MAKRTSLQMRQDSWVNTLQGMGTSRDKTEATEFRAGQHLNDYQLASMFAFEDISAKIVDIYPREAFRNGWSLDLEDQGELVEKKAVRYLKRFDLTELFTSVAIWGRLFGGCAIWIGTDTNNMTPLEDNPRTISFLRDIDRRYLVPFSYYKEGPNIGKTEIYNLFAPQLNNTLLGQIHESRLVIFPGARTERQAKQNLNGWDYSVLQKPYDTLRTSGGMWKAIEILMSDANQAVFKVKDLFRMVGQKDFEPLRARFQLMDLMRSVGRAILLDAESEEFTRSTTNFTGLADLNESALQRVAAAAEVPVSVFGAKDPSGLNATGSSSLLWFWARVHSERTQIYEPRMRELLEILLSAQDSPIRLADEEEISIEWPELWPATAAEKAGIYKTNADADKVYIDSEVYLPEEVALSRAKGSPIKMHDPKGREAVLAQDFETLKENQAKVAAPPATLPGVKPIDDLKAAAKPVPDAE